MRTPPIHATNGPLPALGRLVAAVLRDSGGATALEYAFIAVLVSIAAFVALLALNDSVEAMYTLVSGHVQQATQQP
jgi:Flp pilus assembly pilin Flp